MTTQHQRPAPRFDWFVPIDGDGHHVGTLRAERPPSFEYLRQIVLTAEEHGYHSLLIPTRFANGLFERSAPLAETWTMAAALASATTRIRLLIAVRPGFITTGLFAQMAATLANITDGRIDINVVPGGLQGDFEMLGEASDHAERYRRAEEFMEACRLLWRAPHPVDYAGQMIRLCGAVVSPGPGPQSPRWYLGGASDDALGLAGRQADTLLLWIQPQAAIAEIMQRARREFARNGRPAEFGLRTHLIVRDSEEEAWRAADDLLSQAAPLVRQQRQAVFANTPMVGQQAQARAYQRHRVSERLWNGIASVRVNCGTALVGTPEQVAEELLGYWRLGVDEFILSGYPHTEECVRAARDLLPGLREAIEGERERAPG